MTSDCGCATSTIPLPRGYYAIDQVWCNGHWAAHCYPADWLPPSEIGVEEG